MNATALERRLEAWHEEIRRAVELQLDAMACELRDDLHEAIVELNQRIDRVHREALRALTRAVQKGA